MKKQLKHIVNLEELSRQTGRSTAIAHAAKSVKNGVVIAHNQRYADHIKETFGVEAVSVNNLDALLGRNVVPFYDHTVIYKLAKEANKLIEANDEIHGLTLIKIGGADGKPTPADLEKWRKIFESVQSDKDFKIFTHDEINIEHIKPTNYNANIKENFSSFEELLEDIAEHNRKIDGPVTFVSADSPKELSFGWKCIESGITWKIRISELKRWTHQKIWDRRNISVTGIMSTADKANALVKKLSTLEGRKAAYIAFSNLGKRRGKNVVPFYDIF